MGPKAVSAGRSETAPAEIITGLERLWGKNLLCIPRLSQAHVHSMGYEFILEVG